MEKIWKVKTKVPTCSGCFFYYSEKKVFDGKFRCEKRNIRAERVDLSDLFEKMDFEDWRCGDDYIFVDKEPKPPKTPKKANEKKHDFACANAKKALIVQRRHAEVLELNARGLRVCEIAFKTGYTQEYVSKIIKKKQ